MDNHRSIALDACRGMAVFAVTAYHMSGFGLLPASSPFDGWLACGMFGVDFFYVLSGFFITQAVLGPRVWDPGNFLRARVSRIYPAYIGSLLIVLVFKFLTGHAFGIVMLINVLLHLTMLHNIVPGVGDSLNGVYWTLGVEFPFYMLMLALAPLLRSSRRAFWLASLGMVGLCLLWRESIYLFLSPVGLARFFAATQLPGALDAFAMGGIAAALHRNQALQERLGKLRWLILACGLFWMVFCLRYFISHAGYYWEDWLSVVLWRGCFAIGCAIVTLACAKMRNTHAMRYSGLPWLGKISFSLYLYHVLVMVFVNRVFAGEGWQFRLALSLTIMLAASWASWRFVETRFHRTGPKAGSEPVRPSLKPMIESRAW